MQERILSPQHLNDFRAYLLDEEKSMATIQKYVRDARAFLNYAAGRTVTKALTVAYKKELQDQCYAVRSVNSMLASLNALLDYLEWGDCKVKHLKYQRQTFFPEEKELTKEEYKRLLTVAKKRGQLYYVIQTICATGIRVSELKYFTVETVQRGEVCVRCKNKTRHIFVSGKLRKLLLDYAKKRGIRTGVIFVTRGGKPLDRSNIWSGMKSLCKEANINPDKVFPHNLRKLFARTFYDAEKDIGKLADILGHGSIETTRIYIMGTGIEHRRKIERLGLVV